MCLSATLKALQICTQLRSLEVLACARPSSVSRRSLAALKPDAWPQLHRLAAAPRGSLLHHDLQSLARACPLLGELSLDLALCDIGTHNRLQQSLLPALLQTERTRMRKLQVGSFFAVDAAAARSLSDHFPALEWLECAAVSFSFSTPACDRVVDDAPRRAQAEPLRLRCLAHRTCRSLLSQFAHTGPWRAWLGEWRFVYIQRVCVAATAPRCCASILV